MTTTEIALRVDGHERYYLLRVPNSARPPAALVLDLHGSTSNPREQVASSTLARAADRYGFAVAAPAGAVELDGGRFWHVPGEPLAVGTAVPEDTADDVVFLGAVVRDALRRTGAPAGRVYAAGMSGGGRMVSYVASREPQLFAGIAPVAGLRAPAEPEGPPVAVVAFHGTADPVNPYAGGGGPYWRESVPEAAAAWARRNGCRPVPARTRIGASIAVDRWWGGAADVVLYTVDGGGHTWPGGPGLAATRPEIAAFLGGTTYDIDAAEEAWRFFASAAAPPR